MLLGEARVLDGFTFVSEEWRVGSVLGSANTTRSN